MSIIVTKDPADLVWPDDFINKVICGDCLEVIKKIPDGAVDLVLTDPPYGINLGSQQGPGDGRGLRRDGYQGYEDTYDNFVTLIVPRLSAAIDKATRSIIWTGPHIREQRKANCMGGVYCPAANWRHGWGFKSLLPVLYYGTAPDIHLGAKVPNTIQSSVTTKPNGHPCPKPLEWIRWNVLLGSRDSETVLDPFLGSGTTAVAAKQLGRKFIGIEINMDYCKIAEDRLRQEELF